MLRDKKTISNGFNLFLISFLSLFFEMICIRWIPSNVHVVGFFTNIILISSFLGLGIGCLLTKRKINTIYAFAFLLFLLGELTLYLSKEVSPWLYEDYLFVYLPRGKPLGLYPTLLTIFVLNTFTFVSLGQELGRGMSRFPPLVAYIINIAGSILGIVCLAVFSFLRFQPLVWFGVGLFLMFWFWRKNKLFLVINLIICGMFINSLVRKNEKQIWSPYYRIDIRSLETMVKGTTKLGYYLSVNQQYHQFILNFGSEIEQSPFAFWKEIYQTPYYFLNKPKDILVLGAGAGNDATIALRNNAEHIDVVEIDPLIIDLGRKLNPEKPYTDKRVTVFNTDARSFLKNTSGKYDLVVFGTLDSHTLFSSMSTLRLDNYVYTKESFADVKKCLKANGIVAVMLGSPRPWIGNRTFQLLREVFKQEPVVYYPENPYEIFTFLNGNKPVIPNSDLPKTIKLIDPLNFQSPVNLSTDDWPYFYLKEKIIPSAYLKVLISVLILSAILVFGVTPKQNKFDFHFFFLGSAFMLLETKSITEIALLFGSTWIVNSIVITAILLMILIATVYVAKFNTGNIRIFYILLSFTLITNYLIPLEKLFLPNFILKLSLSSLVVGLPLFFAAIIFAKLFKTVKNTDLVFGSNLLGAMVGGIFEYSSLMLGLKNLYLFALGMYVLSYFLLKSENA